MKITIDRRGWPGAFVLFCITLFCFVLKSWFLFALSFALMICHLAFFRDPVRSAPEGNGLVSPADGVVVEISSQWEDRYLKEEAVKVGIFLSIFVPHVNRAPLAGTVGYQCYELGKFLNALRKESVNMNESNWIGIEAEGRRVLVRQIAGAIARRIHWDVKPNQCIERGEKIGIICYGSRVECFFPKRFFLPTVQIGESVKAGGTILGEWTHGS